MYKTRQANQLALSNHKQIAKNENGRVKQPAHLPGVIHSWQRYLGNAQLQSMSQYPIQRKTCDGSCGGTCPGCRQEAELKKKVQTKLTVGPVNDKYEQEADRVASQIMRMPDTAVSDQQKRPAFGTTIQRLPTTANASQPLRSSIGINQNGGRPLSQTTRQFMEPRFGADFNHVRLHADQKAQQTAVRINARAFTYGNQIALGKGESEQDKKLMAHELTHVVQQGGASHDGQTSANNGRGDTTGTRIQRARLPCTSRKKIDLFAVNLPGSTRSIHDDLPNMNSVFCQCGIEFNVTGGQSIQTNVLNLDPPNGVLNTPTGNSTTPTQEMQQMLQIRPGGNVIHAYYVPSVSSGALAEAVATARFTPPLPDSLIIGNGAGAISIVTAHELGHVLLNDGSHHPNRDNLMARGSVNSGAGELEQSQCIGMP
jgi:hypothetical protein